MQNPREGSEVTEEWLARILTTYERRSDQSVCVKVCDFNVRPGTKPGENVASELAKIWVKAEVWREEEEGKEEIFEEEEEEEEEEEVNGSTNNANEDLGKENTTTTTTTTTTATTTKENRYQDCKIQEEPTTTTTKTTTTTEKQEPDNNETTATTTTTTTNATTTATTAATTTNNNDEPMKTVPTTTTTTTTTTKATNECKEEPKINTSPNGMQSREKRESYEIGDEINETTTTTTTNKNNNNNKTIKEYNLMAKFNTGTEFDREYVKHCNTDLNELLIYSDVIAELNAFQEREGGGKYPIHVPEFIYGVCSGDESVLVMQDVSVLGYKTQDKITGLDLPHILMAAEHLARLHAVSHAYHRKHDFLHRFPTFETDDRLAGFFAYFNAIIYDHVIEVLNPRTDLHHLAEKMRRLRTELFDKLRDIISRETESHRVLCLSHGDAWTNNLMYSHSSDKQGPDDLCLIDWGLVTWRNPVLDLHQVVYNCTSLEFRRDHLGDILRLYHDVFTSATTDLGEPVTDYDFASFMDEWRRTAIFGFLRAGIFGNAIVLSNKAREGFVKGKPSTGLKGILMKCVAKIMVPLVFRGWFWGSVKDNTTKAFAPLFEELRSGENEKMNGTLIDIITEAEENGLMDL